MDHDNDQARPTGTDRQADDRLVHALLIHLHDDQADEIREQRVQRAMQAIRESEKLLSPSRTRRLPTWAKRGAWAAAAMVLLAIGVLVFTYQPTPAMASLNDILGALGRPGDRTYHINMVDMPAPPAQEDSEGRVPAMLPKPGLNDATLYLRDGYQYLLVRNDPQGGVIFDGYDGRQSWRVRAGVLAETKAGLGAGGIPMPPIMANVPFSDLHQTLERIRVDYTVEQFDQAPLPSGQQVLRHVRVRRNSREVKGPETIEIWADPQTAMPRRIVFDRAKVQGNREPCRLAFDLASEAPLSAAWFSSAAHMTEEETNRP